MKAVIAQLWETGREVISFDGSDTGRPTSITELKKCDNVLVGSRICKGGPTEVMIDDDIYLAMPVRVSHPSGGGTMYLLEVL